MNTRMSARMGPLVGPRWLIGLSVLLATSLLLGACQKRPTVEEIVAKIKEVEATTADAHAVLELSIQDPRMDEDMVVEVWEKRPDKFRAELLEASGSEFAAGSIIVNDGSQVWIYDSGANEVLVGEAGANESADQPSTPRDVIRYIDEAIQQVLDQSEVKLIGEEQVAGTPTYVLEFTPVEGEGTSFPVGGKGTLWVDRERWIVLQAHFIVEGLSEGSMHVRSFELNEGIADDPFQFAIPEGATVTQIESKRPTHLTLDEALAQADFLLVPAYLPEGATLIDVFVIGIDTPDEAYVLHYDHSATSFTIVQGPAPMGQQPLGRTTEVTLRGVAATLITDETQGNTFLTWTENGVRIAIAGHISQEEILQVAESLQ